MPRKPQNHPGAARLFPPLEQEVFLGILRAADVLGRGLEEFLKPSGLSPTQYNVLRIVRGGGEEGIACGHIADRMITRDPDITRLLDRLEKIDLISRRRQSDDRRVVRAFITKAGAELLAGIDRPLLQLHRKQLGHLGPRKLRLLESLLEAAGSARE